MELLLICAVLGCIPAAIASSKGRSFVAWWIYGALLFIVALIHSLLISKDHRALEQSQINEGFVKCPYCAEMVKPEAIRCKHCGSDIGSNAPSNDASQYLKQGIGKEIAINEESVGQLAESLKTEMPGHTALSIMVTNHDRLNKIKKSMDSDLAKRFDSLLEHKLSS
ncbi:hypothetical protein SAMN03097719_3204 [Pantoea ananatis]|uniref:zinc ribbon domain-containing protein n=1 Tax=Pantoea ananas TaxID=553 RepID=UPI0009C7B8F8|nr:zinc ribbon domain-containing protein [Pantoea ananatis]SKA79236.1 hypothetical protein SAMN03097719_3204 [Pantoea ananatis]